MRTLIAALLLAVCGGALSQPSPRNEPPKSGNSYEIRADNQRGTRDSPLVIEATSAVPSKANAAAEQAEKDEKAHHEFLIAWGTVALAGVTLGLVVVTGVLARYTYGLYKETKVLREGADAAGSRQAAEMAASLREAGRMADAMGNSAQAAFENAEAFKIHSARQLRAYVHPMAARMETPQQIPSVLVVKLGIKNAGQTPAYKTHQWIAISGPMKQGQIPTDRPPEDHKKPLGNIAPGGETFFDVPTDGPVNLAQWEALKAGDLTLGSPRFQCNK